LIGLVIGGLALYGYVGAIGTPAFLPPLRTTPSASGTPTQFTGTNLLKVLAVNQEATKNGVVLRVNALEQYSDGFSITYSVVSGQPGEPAPVLQPDQFTVTDDRGGAYRLSTLGSSGTVAPGLSTGYLSFAPAPGPDTHTLTVTVPHLLAVGSAGENGAPRVVDGPWQVQVALR
jgi:hypothetical protein